MTKAETIKKRTGKRQKRAGEFSPETPISDRAVRAALDLAAVRPWAGVSMHDIARAAGCTQSELFRVFRERTDILAAYARMVDAKVAGGAVADPGSTERERLFDVMMERFDILNGDRAALLSIIGSFCGDPRQVLSSLPPMAESMGRMLEIAGIEADGPRGALKAMGLFGVYLYALKAWKDDRSADLSKTMAALDRALDRAEQLAAFMKF